MKTKEQRNEYMRIYMANKRKAERDKKTINKRVLISKRVFNKYFTFFWQFFKKNYWVPTTREINKEFNLHYSDNTSTRFNKELVKLWYIHKVGTRYLPTKKTLDLFIYTK